MADFAQLLIRATDLTKTAFDSASKNMRGLQDDAKKLNGFLGKLGAGLSVAGVAIYTKSIIDLGDGLNDMSERLGVSVKDLASFKLAAEQSGTSLDGVGIGIAKLTKGIGEAEAGNESMAQALQSLGITARDPKEAFFQLADAVQRIQDPAKRAALLSQVLGKSYQDLVPLLAQGGEELRKSAAASESFADQMAKFAPNADKFNDQMASLKSNAAGAAAALLNDLIPALNNTFERLERLGRLRDSGASLFEIITGGVSADTSASLTRINGDIADLETSIKRLRENSGGNDQSIPTLVANLERLKKVRAELQVQAAQNIMTPPESAASGKASAGSAGTIKPPAATPKTKSDPLASLLGSTDIGKLAAFDKTVAQLNARFDGGRKNTELYTQAMTKLVETTFSANFTEFNKQLADQDETQKLVADHLKATKVELYAQEQAWSDAGAALTDEMRTPLENANIEFGRLQALLDKGVISWETYTRAVFKTQDAISETPAKLQEMDNFAKQFAENAQNTFADFFKNFDKGNDGMLKKFGETVKGLIAEAVSADLAKRLFGGLADNGKTQGSGWAGSALNLIGSLFGGARAEGGPVTGGVPYLVGERGPEMFVPQGSGSIVPNKAMKGGGHTVIVNVYGNNNAPEVRRAAGQGAREALGLFDGARRYG